MRLVSRLVTGLPPGARRRQLKVPVVHRRRLLLLLVHNKLPQPAQAERQEGEMLDLHTRRRGRHRRPSPGRLQDLHLLKLTAKVLSAFLLDIPPSILPTISSTLTLCRNQLLVHRPPSRGRRTIPSREARAVPRIVLTGTVCSKCVQGRSRSVYHTCADNCEWFRLP